MRHRDNGFPGVPIFHSKLKVCGVRMNFSIHVFVLLHQIQQTFVVWLHCCYSRPKIYRNLWHKNERNDTIEILEKLDVFEIFAPSIFFRAISPWTWSQENQGDTYGSLEVGVWADHVEYFQMCLVLKHICEIHLSKLSLANPRFCLLKIVMDPCKNPPYAVCWRPLPPSNSLNVVSGRNFRIVGFLYRLWRWFFTGNIP